jgi:uncharacterized protein
MQRFHVRRKDREITNFDEMRSVLKTAKYITIALCMDNEPYLVSLSHGYDEPHNCLYFHCAAEGKKLDFAKANPNIWGQALLDYGVTDECDYNYTSVMFQGKLCFVIDLTERMHAMEILVRGQSKKPEEKLAKLNPEKLAKTQLCRIDIDHMTGKKHLSSKISPSKP